MLGLSGSYSVVSTQQQFPLDQLAAENNQRRDFAAAREPTQKASRGLDTLRLESFASPHTVKTQGAVQSMQLAQSTNPLGEGAAATFQCATGW